MIPQSKAYIGHLMLLATTLIYSFNINFMKVVMPKWIKPSGLVLLRCIAGTIGFWLVGLLTSSGKSVMRPKNKEISMIILGGVLGLAGALYASLTPHQGIIKDSWGGNVPVFLSWVSYSFFLLLIQPYTKKFDSIIVMKWMNLSSRLFTLPFGIRQLAHAPLFSATTPLHVWLEVLYSHFCHPPGLFYECSCPALCHSFCRNLSPGLPCPFYWDYRNFHGTTRSL